MIKKLFLLFYLLNVAFITQAQTTLNKTIDYNQGWEFARSVIKADTGYFIFSTEGNFNQLIKLNVIFIDLQGYIKFNKTYGNTLLSYYNGTTGSFKTKSNGKIYGTGSIYNTTTKLSDFALYLLNENGDSSMFKFYGKPNINEIAYDIAEMPDGGFVLVGEEGDFFANSKNVKVIRTDSIGNVLWDTIYGGFRNEGAVSVEYIGNNQIAIGAANYTVWDKGHSWLFVINDIDKSIVWEKFYKGTWYTGSAFFNLTNDGGFILYSRKDTVISGIASKVNYLRKLDSLGNLEWHTDLFYNGHKQIWMARETMDGGFIYCGDIENEQSKHRGYIAKMDAAGNPLWERHYQYNTSSSNYLADIQQTADGGYIAVGMTHDQTQDNWVLKVDRMGCLIPGCHLTGVYDEGQEEQLTIYPNPNSGNFKIAYSLRSKEAINITIFDIAGKQVYQKRYDEAFGKFEVDIDLSSVPAGVYFIRLKTSKYHLIRKVVVE